MATCTWTMQSGLVELGGMYFLGHILAEQGLRQSFQLRVHHTYLKAAACRVNTLQHDSCAGVLKFMRILLYGLSSLETALHHAINPTVWYHNICSQSFHARSCCCGRQLPHGHMAFPAHANRLAGPLFEEWYSSGGMVQQTRHQMCLCPGLCS